MIVVSKTLTNVAFIGHGQHGIHQTPIKINHTCNSINTYNRSNAHQRNKTVENWDRVKSCQINKQSKKGKIKNSY